MNIHSSEILLPPDNNGIQTLLINVPDILQWNAKYNTVVEEATNVFGELPPELKDKILSYNPRVDIAKSELGISIKELFTGYCLNSPIVKKDLEAYLLTNTDKIVMSIFKIYYLREKYFVSLNKYEIIRGDDYYTINKLLDYGSGKDEIGNCETVSKIIEYIGLKDYNYIVLFDNDTTKNIISRRLSCIDSKNYVNSYMNKLKHTFIDYFKEFPLIISKYSQLLNVKKDQKYILYIKQFENKARKVYDKFNMFYRTDVESQKILIEYYNQMF